MQFVGIDVHTNRFTCCYRNETGSDKETKTFELNGADIAAFFRTAGTIACVLIEATITAFSFARLIRERVREALIANTYELKQIRLASNNTDKIDADKLCRIVKMQVLSGEQAVSPVTLPPREIQDLRGCFPRTGCIRNRTPGLRTESICF
jgi:transposase